MALDTKTNRSRREARTWLAPASLLVLLFVLATLQYRWLGQVSRAEQDRLQAGLQSSAARFAEDFDRELTRALLSLQPGPTHERLIGDPLARSVVDGWERWEESAMSPGLVREVWLARHGDQGWATTRLDRQAGAWVEAPWPVELEALSFDPQPFEHDRTPPERPGRGMARYVLRDRVPALVYPLASGGSRGGFLGRFGERRGRASGATLVVWLDRTTLEEELLPRLAARYFGKGEAGLGYRLRIERLGEPGGVVFLAGPGPRQERGSDASADLFGVLPFDQVGGLAQELGIPLGRGPGPPERRTRPFGRLDERRLRFGIYATMGRGDEKRWRLHVVHPDGSLESAVARGRTRNLAVSMGILGLLAAGAGWMAISAQRARRLARQQMEFVAGVTHELLTPLAAMRSAGQNLADGVTAEPERVRSYGSMIDRESTRLSSMVEQVLELSGIESGHRAYTQAPVDLAELVAQALRECEPVVAEAGFDVDLDLPPDLPPAWADAQALQRALQNLIANAVKYGRPTRPSAEPWIGIQAKATARGLEVSVADHGAGIAREDLPHLFEPFYRGRDKASSNVPGSGIGLSLVKHVAEGHGGRVEVETSNEGSSFTLTLPAAPLPAADLPAAPGTEKGEK